jgi:hypothetical protein
MLSNWRNPPRPVEKSAEQGIRITGNTGKSVDGERDSAGSVVARSGVMSVERRGPAVCNGSNKKGGKGEMTKAPISLQDLRRSLYVKAKAEPPWRFWGLYIHVCKMETLREAYQMARSNGGAPGIDGVTFEAIEESGAESFLGQIREELVTNTYRPMQARKKEIPKESGRRGISHPIGVFQY